MTSATATATNSPGWWFSDAVEMAGRNVRHIMRSPDELVMYALVQPIMFILLFKYVFGGAIQVPGGNYTQFLLPGIFVQIVLFGAVAATAVGIADDMSKGIIDRFRSMPVHRSAVLVGRTVSEVGRNLICVFVMVLCGLAVGFRFHGSVTQAVSGFALLLLFGFAFSWVAALIGLAMSSPQAAQSAGTIWLFPFAFISSVYVPTESMPGWLQAYAEHSPVTVMVDTLRAWFNGNDAGPAAWQSVAWSIGLLVVCAPLSVALYRRREG